MSLLDSGLLGAVLAFALRETSALRPWRRAFLIAVLVQAALQLLLEGAYWQLYSAYAVFLLTAWVPLRPRGLSRTIATVLLAILLLLPWMVVPVPRLTVPPGPYPIGTDVFRWTHPSDTRKVVVQAWYPAGPMAGGTKQPFLDGLGRLPESVGFLPRFLFRQYHQIDTFALRSSPVSPAQTHWPVVIFLPGFGAPRAFYTSLVTHVASHGWVVLAVDHPYESPVSELADGSLSVPREIPQNSETDRRAFMATRMEDRAADASFVIDQLSRPGRLGPQLSGRLALNRITVAGHSLGGAAAAVTMHRDPRVIAGANIDGTMHGDISHHPLHHPFLVIESDRQVTGHSVQYVESTQRLLAKLTSCGYRHEISQTNHYAFTDLPLLFSGPGQWLVSQLLGGSRNARETHRITGDLLVDFLSKNERACCPPQKEGQQARIGCGSVTD